MRATATTLRRSETRRAVDSPKRAGGEARAKARALADVTEEIMLAGDRHARRARADVGTNAPTAVRSRHVVSAKEEEDGDTVARLGGVELKRCGALARLGGAQQGEKDGIAFANHLQEERGTGERKAKKKRRKLNEKSKKEREKEDNG